MACIEVLSDRIVDADRDGAPPADAPPVPRAGVVHGRVPRSTRPSRSWRSRPRSPASWAPTSWSRSTTRSSRASRPTRWRSALSLMLPAMNIEDRTELLGGMKHGAPPEVFAGVQALAQSVLDAVRLRRTRGACRSGLTLAVARRVGRARRAPFPRRAPSARCGVRASCYRASMAAPPEANEPRPDRRAGRRIRPARPARAGRAAARGELRGAAGRTVPARCRMERNRHELLVVQRVRDPGRRVPLRRRPGTRRGSRCARRPRSSTTCSSPASARASATASASTASGRRSKACAATTRSCCSIRTARPSTGAVGWGQPVYPYRFGDESRPSTSDSARFMPKSVVVNPYFDWGNDRPPTTPLHETLLYEVHVKGFTQTHPSVPPNLRGTYAGLAFPDVVDWFVGLGVTAVELMPVHQFVHDHRLVQMGLRNYWGYNSIGYFAPHGEYSASGDLGQQVQEFKQMVKTMHDAGIEVILDVVYNHTAEGNHLGPMLVVQGRRQRRVLPPLGRGQAVLRRLHGHRQHAEHAAPARAAAAHGQPPLLGARDARRRVPVRPRGDARAHAARRRPAVGVLRRDPAGSGHQPGQAHRRAVGRRRRRLPGRQLPAAVVGVERPLPRQRARLLARRRSRGSASSRPASPARRDLYEATGSPAVGIDQLRHRARRLHARATSSRTTRSTTRRTARTGATAPTTTARGTAASKARPTTQSILRLRRRQQRNFLATLFLSQGVPMLLAGDEIGRTQRGNNNAYCQDNEISWVDWENVDEELLDVHEPARATSASATPCSGAGVGSRAGPSTAAASATSRGSSPTAAR